MVIKGSLIVLVSQQMFCSLEEEKVGSNAKPISIVIKPFMIRGVVLVSVLCPEAYLD